jgi:hypothetical protein
MPTFDLSGVQALVLQFLGTAATCYIAVKLFILWVQHGWGLIVAELAAAIFVLWFVWFPDSASSTMSGIVQAVTPA